MKSHVLKFGAALVVTLGVTASALAQTERAAPIATTYIYAGSLIAKAGSPPMPRKTIVVQNGIIIDITDGFLPIAPANTTIIDLSDKTVMPGMIDSHVHLSHERGANSRLYTVTKEESDWAFDAMVNARKNLDAGFTTVVDLGAEGGHAIFALRDNIAAGRIIGPRIIAAGDAISASGGHGDIHGYRDDVMHTLASPAICNGADDCRRATRQQIRAGADIIKVTATGGVLSNTAAGLGQQLFDDELKAIADTAHSMGRRVTAHAHSKEGVEAALRAGFDSIEHGTYLDAASIRLFREKGAYLVPTVLAGVTVFEMARNPNSPLTPPQRDKALIAGPLMLDMLERAHAGGVKVAFGTDTGVSLHGENARELELMVQAGFTPTEALHAATIDAAEHLGLSAQIGTIEVGKVADIIAVNGDPTSDISIMRHVKFVMARGIVAKR